jgi:hypothetical protein
MHLKCKYKQWGFINPGRILIDKPRKDYYHGGVY